jgi:succinate dehydrogenase / fumarate reductase cytochrome b subunit
MSESVTSRRPQVYRPGLWTRLSEGLRYGGGAGQRSFLAHRLTGLGVLLFLIIHIIDTFLVVAYPAWYDHTVGIYGGMITGLPWESVNGYYWSLRWGFRLGELALIACVLFHALNGIRIILFDFWPAATRYQRELYQAVLIVFWAIMVVVTIWVCIPLASRPDHWKMAGESASAESGGMPALYNQVGGQRAPGGGGSGGRGPGPRDKAAPGR